jgi:hypothetical protein
MNNQAILKFATVSTEMTGWLQRVRSFAFRVVVMTATIAAVMAAWVVRFDAPYKPGAGFGYALGLIGGSMMLIMLLYPIRKRIRFMHEWGLVKYWFKIHMIFGIVGPLLVVFHSTLRVGSFNAGVALSCMLLVAASGIVGRFIYRRIHHGLYGSRATLQELQQTMIKDLEALDPLLRRMPLVKREVVAFAALVSHKPESRWRGAGHFLSLGWKRSLAGRRVRRAITGYVASGAAAGAASHAGLTELLGTINVTLQAVQRTAQFSTYDRLFSLWHVIHVPFMCMMAITAVVHVVAVHIY